MAVKYPMLTELPSSKDYIEEFGGLNRNLRISPNEFADMCNLTTDEYPVLATTKGSESAEQGYLGNLCGILSGNDFEARCKIVPFYDYVLTNDTEIQNDKQYFEKTVRYSHINPRYWRMYVLGDGEYKITEDSYFVNGKKYYRRNGPDGSFAEVNPKSEGFFVLDGLEYKATTDTETIANNYYVPVDEYSKVNSPEDLSVVYERKLRSSLDLRCQIPGERDYISAVFNKAGESFLYTATNPRDIIQMGANLIIFPDMKYVNLKGLVNYNIEWVDGIGTNGGLRFADIGDMQWEVSSVKDNVGYETFIVRTNEEGDEFYFAHEFNVEANPTYLEDMSDEEKGKVQGPINDKYILETSTGAIYYWIPSTRMWMTATSYVSVIDGRAEQGGVSIFENIHDGDGIRIEGLSIDDTYLGVDVIKKVFDITKANPKGILKGPVKVKKVVGEDTKTQIVLDIKTTFPGGSDGAMFEGCLTYKNYIPKMDFIIENKNRLWGCRYGLNDEGKFVNEIYASKLGDFRSWESFSGVSTDSYMVSVGSDGPFTGAVSYLGRPMFFKENCIHTIYGEYPAQYQMMNTECKGVQVGCGASLVVIDGVLYYKSPGGVSAYTGSMPIEIGEKLNEKENKHYNAVGCGYKGKYYLSMNSKNSFKDGELYVYDIARGIWCKEDKSSIVRMCPSEYTGGKYIITIEPYEASFTNWESGGKIRVENALGEGYRYNPESDYYTRNIKWYAETGNMGLSSNQKKYISRIDVRMALDNGSHARILVQYDSSGVWEQVGVLTNTDLAVVSLPIKIKRCDHFRLRLEGKGQAKIYSLSKTLREGSAK